MKNKVISQVDDEIRNNFDVAVKFVNSLPAKGQFQPSYGEAAKIYSYYKQAKFGQCNQPRPGFWDVINKAKWDAWSSLKDMPQQDAMVNYVDEIKKMYYRFKDNAEFTSTEEHHAGLFVEFLKAAKVPLTPYLLKYVKDHPTEKFKENHEIKTNGVNGNHDTTKEEDFKHHATQNRSKNHNATRNNTNNANHTDKHNHHTPDKIENKDSVEKAEKVINTNINPNNENNDLNNTAQNHNSIIFENNFLINHPAKAVSFKIVNGEDISESFDLPSKNEGENIAIENESSDEEVYCDSIDPDQVTQDALQLELNRSSPALPSISEHTLSSTPLEKPSTKKSKVKTNHVDAKEISSSETSIKSDFEIVDKSESSGHSIIRKNTLEYSTSSSHNKCDILDELEKPFPPSKDKHKHHHRHHYSKSRKYKPPEINQMALRDHKRQTHTSSNNTDQENKNTPGNHQSTNHGNRATSYNSTSNRYHHRHTSSGSSDNNGSDDGETTTSISSAGSGDNIGLKIVQALERMEENLLNVLDRLDSIENNMKVLSTQPAAPWWHEYIPTKSTTFSIAWPVLVNILFYILWRRKMKQKLRK